VFFALSSPGSVKRSFDRFVNDRIQRIDEYRPRTGEKVGILWFVKQFDDLAQLAETIFDKAERRTDLDRAYKKLLQGVLRGIEQCANRYEINFSHRSALLYLFVEPEKSSFSAKNRHHLFLICVHTA
jgi:hypothetical protein